MAWIPRASFTALVSAALVSAALAIAGCYRAHEFDLSGAEPRDAGTVQRDALVPEVDAFVPRLDAGPPRCFVDERARAGFEDPQPEPSPSDPTVLEQGKRIGALRLDEVRVARDAAAGNYTVEAFAGRVTLSRNGSVVGSAMYDERAFVGGGPFPGVVFSFPGALELGVSSAEPGEASLSGLPALFDGERVLRVSPPTVIRAGLESGPFLVGPIEVDPRAAPGDYRLTGEHLGDTITVDRDGVPVGSVTYSWSETIGVGRVHVFDFEGLFSIEIGNSHPGTRNLHRLEDWLFDGRDVLRISCR